MTLPSTQCQLVRFAYGELPVLERLETEYALGQSAQLRGKYKELRSAIDELPRVTFTPSRISLDAILAYSRHD